MLHSVHVSVTLRLHSCLLSVVQLEGLLPVPACPRPWCQSLLGCDVPRRMGGQSAVITTAKSLGILRLASGRGHGPLLQKISTT